MNDPAMNYPWLDLAKRLQAIAQAGLTFSENKYDIDRYEQLRKISQEVMQDFTDAPMEKITRLFATEKGYQTPKVDVRGVVFRDHKILLVKEGIDGLWSIPGGWADIGLSPAEIAVKEIQEEAGLEVKADRLLAVLDKHKHLHPPDIYHAYKIFIRCTEIGGILKPGMETLDAGFFSMDKIPELSAPRITSEQVNLMFSFLEHPDKPPVCD
jgi:ADP-ribose pyrophosphatase YjhB (NUDIX family)